jgi:hypothetical protein
MLLRPLDRTDSAGIGRWGNVVTLINHPALVLLVTVAALWLSAWVGKVLRAGHGDLNEKDHDDLGMILGSTLTLLGLIIGFTFSMAISRYDLRKNYEEAEANAIGTEYVRADLMAPEDAEKVRGLLKDYLQARISYYQARRAASVAEVDAKTTQLQDELWKAVTPKPGADESALKTLTVSGMNDVLNSQGYTQAAWWNRIPRAAWGLMWSIAIFSNAMLGYFVRPVQQHWLRLLVLPLIVGVSFFLIADIDSPRFGIIQVAPQNLLSLQSTLK